MLIIGVGNEYRGDDAVGIIVARRLKEKIPTGVSVVEESGEGVSLMERWKDVDTVIVIDAVRSGAIPGTIYRFNPTPGKETIPSKFFNYSTHAFSLAEAIEMARSLGRLPEQLIVYGIEGKKFAAGAGLSAKVEEASREVERRVLNEIKKCTNYL